jgi:hypothetical protein
LTWYSFPGLLLANFPVSGEVKGVYDRNSIEKFVWVDDSEGLQLRLLDTFTELLSHAYERPGASLSDVVRIANNSFVISTSDGLLRYNYSNDGTVILDGSAPEGTLYFDEFSQLVYLVTDQSAGVYGINGEQLGNFSFPRDIIHIGFDYNR